MKKIIYAVMIAATIYLNMMYKWPMGIYLLSAELCLFFFCVLSAFHTSLHVRTALEMDKIIIEQGENCNIVIKIQNRSITGASVKTVLTYHYISGGGKQKLINRSYINKRDTKEETCCFVPDYCGKIEIHVKKIYCYGFLELFAASKKCNEIIMATVMPKPHPVNLIVSNKTKWFPIDGESYADNRSGEDSAEIYDVREYQAGDRMQKVHWKLSAREDSLYIKEFSYPLGAAVIFMLEGGRSSSAKNTPAFIEAVVTIATALMEAGCPHYVIWKKKEDDKIQRLLIQNEEDLYELIINVVEFESNCLETDMDEWYRYEYKNETYSTMMKIDTELSLQINENEKMDMAQTGLKDFFQTVEIVV